MHKRLPILQDEAPGAAGGGSPAAPPAPSAAAPLLTPPTPAAPAAPAGATPPNPDPGAAPAADGAPAWLPEKYRVMGADGKFDLNASGAKMGEGLSAAYKRIGTGDLPPEKPEGYGAFTPPEKFKDVAMDEGLSNAFRGRAHAAGLTQKQYEFVMGEYFNLVPGMLDAAAKVGSDNAREALQQVWKQPGEYDAGIAAANKAMAGLGPANAALAERVFSKFGADPDFIQFAAVYGKEIREDRPPAGAAAPAGGQGVDALMASAAYRDPKHPEHAAVSQRVQEHFKRTHGTAAAI